MIVLVGLLVGLTVFAGLGWRRVFVLGAQLRAARWDVYAARRTIDRKEAERYEAVETASYYQALVPSQENRIVTLQAAVSKLTESNKRLALSQAELPTSQVRK